jgi:hypothetical protein
VHNRGNVLRAIVALAAVVSLAGCSALSSATGSAESGTSAGGAIAKQALQNPSVPTAGLCWQIAYAEFLQEPDVSAGRRVPCSTAHQAYTIAVNSLSSALLRADADSAAVQSCLESYDALLPDDTDAYRILLSEVLPSVTQWAAGQTWVRCDIQETAVGSSFRTPTFANLPTNFLTFVDTFKAAPATYAMCVDEPGTTGTTGPQLGAGAIIADCSTGQWRLEPSPDFPEPPGDAYPGYSGLYPYLHSHCGALYDTATVGTFVFYPDDQEWADGSRDFECWAGKR